MFYSALNRSPVILWAGNLQGNEFRMSETIAGGISKDYVVIIYMTKQVVSVGESISITFLYGADLNSLFIIYGGVSWISITFLYGADLNDDGMFFRGFSNISITFLYGADLNHQLTTI